MTILTDMIGSTPSIGFEKSNLKSHESSLIIRESICAATKTADRKGRPFAMPEEGH